MNIPFQKEAAMKRDWLFAIAALMLLGINAEARQLPDLKIKGIENGIDIIKKTRADLIVENYRIERDEKNTHKVIVKIKNIGLKGAPQSTTCLITDKRVFTASTPALNPGQSATVKFRRIDFIFGPDATFTIKADCGCVIESNESNNEVDGTIVG
jgi:subtilase family serine protease